jgi:hypothetical protein
VLLPVVVGVEPEGAVVAVGFVLALPPLPDEPLPALLPQAAIIMIMKRPRIHNE